MGSHDAIRNSQQNHSLTRTTVQVASWITNNESMAMTRARDLVVRALNRRATTGIAQIGTLTLHCALGRAGMTYMKREGDGATPIGRWPVAHIWYRADRVGGFYAGGALNRAAPLNRRAGWCDATGDRNYNRPVRHPYPASAEALWRDDHLYDVIVVLEYNLLPRVQGYGSAIFMHLARENEGGGLAPTAGCVALRRRDLAIVMRSLRPGSAVRIVL